MRLTAEGLKMSGGAEGLLMVDEGRKACGGCVWVCGSGRKMKAWKVGASGFCSVIVREGRVGSVREKT